MQEKPKKEKGKIKLRDIKPAKDPKGGYPPPCGPGRTGLPGHPDSNNHNETFVEDLI